MKQQFIDTHAHLYLDDFRNDIDEIVERAKQNNISEIYLPNIDSKTIEPMHFLKAKYPDFFKEMIGLHPCDVDLNFEKELDIVKNEAEKNSYCAIGEIGIDLHWDKSLFKLQEKAFEQQIQLAINHNLPFVIHARESFPEIFNSLRKFDSSALNGIFHSFTGTYKDAQTALSLGDFKLGINGIVTFKNSGLADTVAKIGLQHLVLETDAPFLAPVPYRGKRNESSYLTLIAQSIANALDTSLDDVANITTKNAKYVFSKKETLQ